MQRQTDTRSNRQVIAKKLTERATENSVGQSTSVLTQPMAAFDS